MKQGRTAAQTDVGVVGFAVVDGKGRLSLPKPVRRALGLDAGASVAWVALGGTVLLMPQGQHLADLSARAQAALATAGLSVGDVLAQLPAARAEVVAEAYGPDLVREITQAQAAAHRRGGVTGGWLATPRDTVQKRASARDLFTAPQGVRADRQDRRGERNGAPDPPTGG